MTDKKIIVLLKGVVALLIFLPAEWMLAQSKRLQKAEAYFQVREYASAAEYFDICPKKDSVTFNKIAYCQMMCGKVQQAETSYRTFINKHQQPDTNMYHFALTLKRNKKYQEAKSYFQQLSRHAPLDKHFSEQLLSCDSAFYWEKNPAPYVVSNLEKINSEFSDVTAVPHLGILYFASNRESTMIRKKSDMTSDPYFNILTARFDSASFKLSYPKPLKGPVNTDAHELAPTFSADGKQLFFTHCDENLKLGSNYSRKLKLYASEWKEEQWGKPNTFIFNDSSCSYAHPCMSSDGKLFFFTANLKGGFGGADIYACLRIEGKWTSPINLGPGINTPGDELYPFYHVASGKLFFASNYHTGMGGFDLFEAREQEGEWMHVRNLGVPFNSPDDDFALFFNHDFSYAFLSSNRAGGIGKEDVYMLKKKDLP